ncbi:MAG: hypothetical protein LBI20_00885 [Holosporales bacterium]|jgi:hypothetical protein|nr:hypothetical protein [Holosporales bacterium]
MKGIFKGVVGIGACLGAHIGPGLASPPPQPRLLGILGDLYIQVVENKLADHIYQSEHVKSQTEFSTFFKQGYADFGASGSKDTLPPFSLFLPYQGPKGTWDPGEAVRLYLELIRQFPGQLVAASTAGCVTFPTVADCETILDDSLSVQTRKIALKNYSVEITGEFGPETVTCDASSDSSLQLNLFYKYLFPTQFYTAAYMTGWEVGRYAHQSNILPTSGKLVLSAVSGIGSNLTTKADNLQAAISGTWNEVQVQVGRIKWSQYIGIGVGLTSVAVGAWSLCRACKATQS